jgi:hypothetical protein
VTGPRARGPKEVVVNMTESESGSGAMPHERLDAWRIAIEFDAAVTAVARAASAASSPSRTCETC